MVRATLLSAALLAATLPAAAPAASSGPPAEFFQVVAARAFEHPNPAVVEATRVLKQSGFLAEIYQVALSQGSSTPPGQVDGARIAEYVATWRSQTSLGFNNTTYSVDPCHARPVGEARIIEARPTVDPQRVGTGALDVHLVIPFHTRCKSGSASSNTDYYFWLQLDPATGFVTRSKRTGFRQEDAPPWKPRE